MSNVQESDVLEYPACPGLAVAALIYMMGHFAEVRRPAVAMSILAHLHLIASDARLPAAVRGAARQAHGQWRARLSGGECRAAVLDS
jgi:hypothetical protein